MPIAIPPISPLFSDEDGSIPSGSTDVQTDVCLGYVHDGSVWRRASGDSTGKLNVNVSSAALPTGAATESTLSEINAKLVNGNDIGDVTVNNLFNYNPGGSSSGVNGRPIFGHDGTLLTLPLTDPSGRLLCREYEAPTFTIWNVDTAPGNNKSMMSILNGGGSSVTVRLKKILLINSATASVTGVITDFRLFKITGHSAGTQITPVTHDTTDSLNGSVTVRTGATVSGEVASYLHRAEWSSDEHGTGTLDQEGHDHAAQYIAPFYKHEGTHSKPLTLHAGEGLTLKCATNTTAGFWDIAFIFTVE